LRILQIQPSHNLLYIIKVIRAMYLSKALKGNAALTAFCAAVCLFAADWVAGHVALPGPIWALALGAMLASYVPVLLIAAARPLAWLVKTIVVLDWGFVAIASVYLVTYWGEVAGPGIALIIVPTVAVALFALLQSRGLDAVQQGSPA
jgi:hypothetical protein